MTIVGLWLAVCAHREASNVRRSKLSWLEEQITSAKNFTLGL
jgi:hypothetical protein